MQWHCHCGIRGGSREPDPKLGRQELGVGYQSGEQPWWEYKWYEEGKKGEKEEWAQREANKQKEGDRREEQKRCQLLTVVSVWSSSGSNRFPCVIAALYLLGSFLSDDNDLICHPINHVL